MQKLDERLKSVETAISADGSFDLPPLFSIQDRPPVRASAAFMSPTRSRASAHNATVVEPAISTTPSPNIQASLHNLYAYFSKIEDKTLKTFFERYFDMEEFLQTQVALKDLLMTTEMKQSLVLNAHDDLLQTARLLEAMDMLMPLLERKMPIEGFPSFERSLAHQEHTLTAQTAQAYAIHTRLEQLTDDYHEVINLLSQRLLDYTATLNDVERMLDAELAAL